MKCLVVIIAVGLLLPSVEPGPYPYGHVFRNVCGRDLMREVHKVCASTHFARSFEHASLMDVKDDVPFLEKELKQSQRMMVNAEMEPFDSVSQQHEQLDDVTNWFVSEIETDNTMPADLPISKTKRQLASQCCASSCTAREILETYCEYRK